MSEFSFEQLQQMRVANIQSQFVNSEELQKGEQDELEKARHGTYADTAENRRLNRVGQEYGHKAEEKQPSGQRTKKTEEASGAGGKTVADHAADTDSKVLQKVVDDPNAKPELKEAAQAELKKRGEEKKDDVPFDVNLEVAEKMWSEEESKKYDKALEENDEKTQKKLLNIAIERAKKKGVEIEMSSKERKPMQSKRFTKEDSKQKASESLKSAFSKLEEEYEKVYDEEGNMDMDSALAADDKFLKTVHKLIISGGLDKKTFMEIHDSNPNWKYGFQGMPSYEEIRDDEEYMSDEEKNSPDFGAKRFETFIYTDDGFDQDAAIKLDNEFNESVYKLIKDGKLDEDTFEEIKKKHKDLSYGFDLPTYEEYKKHDF